MKILISDISSYKSIVLSKFLKENYENCELFTFDYRNFTKKVRTKYSDYHIVVENYQLQNILNLIEKNEIDFFFPVNSDLIDICIFNKDKFGKTINYLGDYSTFTLLNTKDRLMDLAFKLNIQIPKTYQKKEEIEFPCVLKPTISASSIGVNYFMNEEEFKVKNISINSDCIVQEYVEGVGVGYSVYAREGAILKAYGHKRLGEYPVSGGSSVYREGFYHKDMEQITEKILSQTKWTGFAMFEFKLTKENQIYLIEINPRIWGSLNQGLQNGINYLEPILGRSTNYTNRIFKSEKRTYVSPLIYISIIKYALKFNFFTMFIFFRNFNTNKLDVSLFKDFKGFLSTIYRKIK